MKPIAVTAGEPAGIGPELCLDALNGDCPRPLVVVGARKVLSARARLVGAPFNAAAYPAEAMRAVLDCPAAAAVTVGAPDAGNAGHVLQQLRIAAEGCMSGRFAAMVTAPVSKETIIAAGHDFTGQTEYLAELSDAGEPVMLLAGPRLRAAPATTHIPLAQVAGRLSVELLVQKMRVIHDELPRYFKTQTPPLIRVCGLNPHAGEGGYIGDEERRVIKPAIDEARRHGIRAEGPFAADTVYMSSLLPAADCVLAMYHDQAFPAVKLLDFDNTVNVTLGLPFLRASPDHGIAADIAGGGGARPHSMRAALALAAAV